MKNLLRYLLDPQPGRGCKIILIGMLVFVVFINAYGYVVEQNYLTIRQGRFLYWLAMLGWVIGVIGAVNHIKYVYLSRSK